MESVNNTALMSVSNLDIILYGVYVYWGSDIENQTLNGLTKSDALDLFRRSLKKWELDGGCAERRPSIFAL